jgi:hypothetical protein
MSRTDQIQEEDLGGFQLIYSNKKLSVPFTHQHWEDILGLHIRGLANTFGGRASEEMWSLLYNNAVSANRQRMNRSGLLSPLPIPAGAWQDLSMDFIDSLPMCEGYSVILVVVDHFTKYAHFIPLKHPYSAQSVALAFFNTVVKLHGLPKTIVSDRDKIFTSAFWKELFKLLNTQLCLSSAYHAQSDGQTEHINHRLEAYLKCYVSSTPR